MDQLFKRGKSIIRRRGKMTKYGFLNELDQLLNGLDADERKEILEDYEEHFAFAKRANKSDKEVIELVGTPAEIASEILGTATINDHDRESGGSKEGQAGTLKEGITSQVDHLAQAVTDTVESVVGSLSGVITETFESHPEDALEGATRSNTLIEEVIDVCGVRNVIISARNQKVEIKKTTYPTARIRLTRGMLATRIEGDTFHIEAREIKRKFGIGNFVRIEFPTELKIELPEMVYESIKAQTENAKIEIETFELNQLELESMNGKVEAKRIVTGELKLKTINGGLEAKDVKGSIDASTTNGKIELLRVDGSIYAQTTNGKIELEKISGNIDANTSNSKIELKNDTINQDVKLSTSNAKIEVKLLNKPNHATFDLSTCHARTKLFGTDRNHQVLGDGTNKVTLSTSNDKIEVYETLKLR